MNHYTGAVPDTQRLVDWRTFGACRAVDPDLFFPNPGDTRGIEAAQQICATCPVPARMACLTEALREEGGRQPSNRHGIRGGLTGTQRRSLYEKQRSRRKRAREQAAA
ncbi:WhiB family transcriptional regulator [Streptomyces chartreusis]|uniref:WhiB family transcriptional regulator n=1 Tax=Streptomyces chartreusis TaxID=1969 RepID=UPI002E192717